LESRLPVFCYSLKIEQVYWPALKTFMTYLHMIPETEMKQIDMDSDVCKQLEQI